MFNNYIFFSSLELTLHTTTVSAELLHLSSEKWIGKLFFKEGKYRMNLIYAG